MTSPVADAKFYADFQNLAALKNDARAQSPQALREAARQFESIFAKMVLSSMRKASFGDPLLGSDQQNFYQGMFDDQMAVQLSQGRGLGLADMLVRQLGRAGLVPATDSGTTPAKSSGGSANVLSPTTAASGLSAAKSTAANGIPTATNAAASAAPSALQMFTDIADPFDTNTMAGFTQAGTSAIDATTAFIAKMLTQNSASGSAETGSAMPVAANTQQTPWRPASPEEFVRELWPCAEAAGAELGIDPRHLLAQAALETGWGQSLPCATDGRSSFNLFGIKAGTGWNGQSVAVRTLEFEGGIPVAKQARFRAYDSAADSFRDYVSVLRDNPRYAAALNTGSDTKAFAQALQRGGYATDPAYARKIAAIAQNLDVVPTAFKSVDDEPISPPLGLF